MTLTVPYKLSKPYAGFPGGFCVLMAVYQGDDARLFNNALISVFENTLQPDQFVLVVDGFIPESIENVIGAYRTCGRLEVVRLASNQGLARALNAGIERVRFEWIVRADADDANLPDRFENQAAAAIADSRLDVIGGSLQEVEIDGTPIAIRRTPLFHEAIVKRLPSRNPINHPAVAYRTALVKKVGGYPQVYLKEDYALWCLFARAGARFRNLDQILVLATAGLALYRRRGGWRYIRSEIDIQALMIDLGLKSRTVGIAHGAARGLVFALPGWVRGIIYRYLLRSSIKTQR